MFDSVGVPDRKCRVYCLVNLSNYVCFVGVELANSSCVTSFTFTHMSVKMFPYVLGTPFTKTETWDV